MIRISTNTMADYVNGAKSVPIKKFSVPPRGVLLPPDPPFPPEGGCCIPTSIVQWGTTSCPSSSSKKNFFAKILSCKMAEFFWIFDVDFCDEPRELGHAPWCVSQTISCSTQPSAYRRPHVSHCHKNRNWNFGFLVKLEKVIWLRFFVKKKKSWGRGDV